METIAYYIDYVITLCGFDGAEGSAVLGWTMVSLATGIVIYAVYEGVTKAIWPGETNVEHIKYRILDDVEGDTPHAD